MTELLYIWLFGLGGWIEGIFDFIFPEYPAAGIAVCLIFLALFIFYLIKSGFKHALKISLSISLGLIFVLYAIHSLGKIFRL